jgi:hypothetical protein
MLTHVEPQTSGAPAAQVAAHTAPDAPIEHSGVAPSHFVPQAPQFCESVRLVSQMSSARVEQWPNPVAHAASGTKHEPDRHSTPAAPDLTFGSIVQS